jgi:Predicted metal-dependent membrane protease
MNQRGKSFYAIVIFLAAEAIQVAMVEVVLLLRVLILIIQSAMEPKNGLPVSDQINTILQQGASQNLKYLISVISIVVCGIVFFVWYKAEIRGETRGTRKSVLSKPYFLLLISLGIGCQFAVSGIMAILQQYFVKLFEDYANQMDLLMDGNTIVVLLLLTFVAPITEELIFRGMILHRTNRYVPFVAANLIQATLFGIYHFNVVQGIYAALLGFLLGLVYRKFKTIIAPIVLHMTVNISSFLMYLFPNNFTIYLIIVSVGGIIIVGTLCKLKLSTPLVEDAYKE